MKQSIAIVMALFFLVSAGGANEAPVFKRQVIQIPAEGRFNYAWRYMCDYDLDENGLTDLLAVSPLGKVFVYRQNQAGFPAEPSQRIQFPPNTAWFAVADVSDAAHLEILISTGAGLACYRHSNGVFESQPQTLIEARQVFAEENVRFIHNLGKPGGRWDKRSRFRNIDINKALPMIFSDHVTLYEPDEKYQYKGGAEIALDQKLSMGKNNDEYLWTLGDRSPSELWIQSKARDKSAPPGRKKPEEENAYIKEMVEKIEAIGQQKYNIVEHDINGDGQEDVTLVQVMIDIDLRTNLITFIRRKDGALPAEPDEVLRCRGMPIVGDYLDFDNFSPYVDINNDGFMDVVLLEWEYKSRSVNTLLEVVMTKGIDWQLTMRLYDKQKGFPSRPDFRMDITTRLIMMDQHYDLVTFADDFNGDGRPDIITRRTPTQCNIYLSSPDGFYHRRSHLQLDVPPKGWTFVKDLNSDGVSDIYMIDYQQGQITVFLSEKGTSR